MPTNPQKQLQRLPHVFGQVLELPLRSDADVFIEDGSDCFRFTVNIEENTFSGKVKAHVVKIHPEVTKVIVMGGGNGGAKVGMLEIDAWRFRLPETARPELATAVVIKGELIVKVPKGGLSSRRDRLKMAVAEGGLYLYIRLSS